MADLLAYPPGLAHGHGRESQGRAPPSLRRPRPPGGARVLADTGRIDTPRSSVDRHGPALSRRTHAYPSTPRFPGPVLPCVSPRPCVPRSLGRRRAFFAARCRGPDCENTPGGPWPAFYFWAFVHGKSIEKNVNSGVELSPKDRILRSEVMMVFLNEGGIYHGEKT